MWRVEFSVDGNVVSVKFNFSQDAFDFADMARYNANNTSSVVVWNPEGKRV